MSKREIFVLAVMGAGIVWGLRSPLVASCLFTWNNIFRPLLWAKTKGILSPAVLPTHYVVAGVLACSSLAHAQRLRWNLGCTFLLILVVRTWIGVPFAVHEDIAFDAAVELSKYFIPMILIGCILTDRRSQELYFYVLALSVGIHLAWAGFHGPFLRGQVERAMSIPGGQMTDRNDFMVAATGCLPLMGYVAFYYEGRWKRPLRLALKGMLAFCCIAFFYSGSRGAILGLSGLVAWWAVMTGRPGRRLTIALVLFVIALPLIPTFVWERMSTIEWSSEQTEGSAASRMEAMEFGLELTLDRPILGVGPENSWRVAADHGFRPDRPGVGIETHFIWLKCSSEYGIPVLAFFLWVIGLTLWRLRNRARAARAIGDRSAEEMATALSCAIVGFLATGTFTSKFLSEYLWGFFVLSHAMLATPLAAPADSPATRARSGKPPVVVPARPPHRQGRGAGDLD